MENLRELISTIFDEALALTDGELITPLEDDTVLLESGLDSLGFAILVARLEEELGFDPFSMMEEPVYPTTFKAFIDVYQQTKKTI